MEVGDLVEVVSGKYEKQGGKVMKVTAKQVTVELAEGKQVNLAFKAVAKTSQLKRKTGQEPDTVPTKKAKTEEREQEEGNEDQYKDGEGDHDYGWEPSLEELDLDKQVLLFKVFICWVCPFHSNTTLRTCIKFWRSLALPTRTEHDRNTTN